MEHTAGYKNYISGMVFLGGFFQVQMKRTGNNMYQFVLCVPVILHFVSGTVRVLMIIGDGKIKTALGFSFLIINILHLMKSFQCGVSAKGKTDSYETKK